MTNRTQKLLDTDIVYFIYHFHFLACRKHATHDDDEGLQHGSRRDAETRRRKLQQHAIARPAGREIYCVYRVGDDVLIDSVSM